MGATPMSFDNVMATAGRWSVGVEALAALGAELSLKLSGRPASPEIAAALAAVSRSAGLDDLEALTPQQQAIIAGFARMAVRHAADLLDDPGREPGWAYTDPVILDGWGRGSAMVPGMLASAASELREVTSLLD